MAIVCILIMSFGSDIQLEKNCSEVQAEVGVAVQTWIQRLLSLKGRAEVCTEKVLNF